MTHPNADHTPAALVDAREQLAAMADYTALLDAPCRTHEDEYALYNAEDRIAARIDARLYQLLDSLDWPWDEAAATDPSVMALLDQIDGTPFETAQA